MSRILLLTKNILSEKEFQATLQRMNYEVLVSASIYSELSYHMPVYDMLKNFQLIIFSDILTDEEIEITLPVLEKEGCILAQRVDGETSEFQIEHNIKPIILSASSREINETIEDLVTMKNESSIDEVDFVNDVKLKETIPLLQVMSFTKIEQRILEVLYKAKGKLVTKETLCNEVWGEAVSKSRMVQVYTSLRRIKDKLQVLQPNTLFIGTQRSVGYFLMPTFYEVFDFDLPIYKKENNSLFNISTDVQIGEKVS